MKLTRTIVTLALTLVLLAGVLTVPTFAAVHPAFPIRVALHFSGGLSR